MTRVVEVVKRWGVRVVARHTITNKKNTQKIGIIFGTHPFGLLFLYSSNFNFIMAMRPIYLKNFCNIFGVTVAPRLAVDVPDEKQI